MTDNLWTKETPVRTLHRWEGDTKKTQFQSGCAVLQIIDYTLLIKKTRLLLVMITKTQISISLLQFLCWDGFWDTLPAQSRDARGSHPFSPVLQLWNSSALSIRKAFSHVVHLYLYSLSTWGSQTGKVMSDTEILNLKHLFCFLSFPIFLPSRGHLTTHWCKTLMLYHPAVWAIKKNKAHAAVWM